jgi:hypothetical protein
MIPAVSGFLSADFKVKEQPTLTYAMDYKNDIRGCTDGIEAIKQAVYKILNTERYEYIMYSWNYGVELKSLYGKRLSYVYPELKRRIKEALTQDTRITDVSEFSFEIPKKGVVHAAFTVHTILGEIKAERTVEI